MTDEEIAVKLTETEARSKSNSKRIVELERRQDDIDSLAVSMSRMDERQAHMDNDVKEIKADVKELSGKPAEKWDRLLDLLLAAVVGAFLAWLIGGAA